WRPSGSPRRRPTTRRPTRPGSARPSCGDSPPTGASTWSWSCPAERAMEPRPAYRTSDGHGSTSAHLPGPGHHGAGAAGRRLRVQRLATDRLVTFRVDAGTLGVVTHGQPDHPAAAD